MAINSDISAPAKIGVFLCRCGGKIEGRVDLDALEETLKGSEFVHHVEILPFTCMTPGLKAVRKTVADQGLNRLIIAGCESRVMLKKFEGELEDLDIFQGQIEMVNLRDHVAQSNNGEPGELAAKGARLIVAAARALSVLAPSPKVAVTFEGPVMILGGGIATYPAAQELVRRNIDTIIAVNTDDPEDEIRMMHEQYPGDRHYHDRLRAIMKEVFDSPHIKKISVGELEKVMGRMGDYQVTFSGEKGRPPLVFNCSAIIAALDGQMRNQGSDFGHDGRPGGLPYGDGGTFLAAWRARGPGGFLDQRPGNPGPSLRLSLGSLGLAYGLFHQGKPEERSGQGHVQRPVEAAAQFRGTRVGSPARYRMDPL